MKVTNLRRNKGKAGHSAADGNQGNIDDISNISQASTGRSGDTHGLILGTYKESREPCLNLFERMTDVQWRAVQVGASSISVKIWRGRIWILIFFRKIGVGSCDYRSAISRMPWR